MLTGILYKEEQNLPFWVYLLFLSWIPILLVLPLFEPKIFERKEVLFIFLALIAFEIILIGMIGKLSVIVKWNELIIKIGFFGLTAAKIKKVEIKDVQILEGSLWKNYGGWGIRMAFGTVAYIYSGDGGIKIEVGDLHSQKKKFWKVRKIVISSKNPVRLMEAIMSMT
jgi:hypothetical protein